MPLFYYKAISTTGEVLTGEIDADSRDAALAQLQGRGHIPVNISAANAGNLRWLLSSWTGKKANSQRIALVTQQLATLLAADLALDRALQLLLDLTADDAAFAQVLRKVRDQVREGATLSEALANHPRYFSRFYLNMVRAGELGGSLAQSLSRLSDYLEKSQAVKRQVVSALIYPALLLVMTIASLLILLTHVVPQFAPMFEEAGSDLPLLTQIVLGFGALIQHYWWALVLLLVAVMAYAQQQLAQQSSRYRWHRRWLRWKGLGSWITKIEVARFARTLGTLVDNGVALVTALRIARQVVANAVLNRAIEEATDTIKSGGALSAALAKQAYFPTLALQIIQVGEESGQLPKMLLRVADIYDKDIQTTLERLLGLLVPVTILLLAVMIAVIVMSILMAIISVNDLFL